MATPKFSINTIGLLVACFAVTTRADATDRVYVLSQSGAALSEIEDGADKPTWSLPLDKAPAALTLAHDGTLAYVTHPDIGQVSVIDLERRIVASKIPVEGSPFGIAATKDGRLFVADWNSAHVSVIDASGAVAAKTIPVGRAPAHILLSPDEKLLFVANRESDTVSVVRTADLAGLATITVGHAPFAMALSPDGARLYIGNVQGGSVSVVDTANLAVIETLESGAMPYGAAVTPDASRIVVTLQTSGSVSVLSDTKQPAPSIKVGSYPEGVVINSAGTRAYVANWFSDNLSVLDLETMKEVSRIKFPAGPRGVAISPRGP